VKCVLKLYLRLGAEGGVRDRFVSDSPAHVQGIGLNSNRVSFHMGL